MSKIPQGLPPGIALGGFMGVGKSTVGRLVAEALGLPFHDTDAILTERFGAPGALIRERGEPAFRALERDVVAEVAARGPAVLATGGGVWVEPANRATLRARHLLVVLTAPLDVLAARVGSGHDRPMWDADVAARYAARAGAYADADLVVDTSTASPADVAAQIAAWWRQRCAS